jgi:hypothetical protein
LLFVKLNTLKIKNTSLFNKKKFYCVDRLPLNLENFLIFCYFLLLMESHRSFIELYESYDMKKKKLVFPLIDLFEEKEFIFSLSIMWEEKTEMERKFIFENARNEL